MRKRIVVTVLASAAVLFVMFFARTLTTEARWWVRDETYANPFWVCQDGVFIGLAADPDTPGGSYFDVNLRASVAASNATLLEDTFRIFPDQGSGFGMVGYFLLHWDPGIAPLAAGTSVQLSSVSSTFPVQPCRLADVDQRWQPIDLLSIDVQRVCRDGISMGTGINDENGSAPFADADLGVIRNSDRASIYGAVHSLPRRPHMWMTHALYDHFYFTSNQPPGTVLRVVDTNGDFATYSPRLVVEDCRLQPDVPALTTAFGYQGLLEQEGRRATGLFDLRFRLFDAPTAGNLIAGPLDLGDVTVEKGVFYVTMDFGKNAFDGGERWLEMQVRPGNSTGSYTVMSPRQQLQAVPFASSLVPGASVSGSVPDPLLTLDNFSGNGLQVRDALDGVVVESARGHGVVVHQSDDVGLLINQAGTDGVRICSGGSGQACFDDQLGNGLEIHGAQSDALQIFTAPDDGIEIGDANTGFPNFGLYVPSPGVRYIGLWPNTEDVNGYWGLWTQDRIGAANVTASTISLLAQVDGQQALQPGDIVAVTGVAEPLGESTAPLPRVQLATNDDPNIVGVVEHRLVWAPIAGVEKQGELVLQNADGPAAAGDYVSLVVYGVANVRLGSGEILSPGTRLTVGDSPGSARALRSQVIDGLTVSEGAPSIGVLLDLPDEASGLAPVLVTLR